MPAPVTVDEFLDLVRKSGVVEEKRLNSCVEKLRTTGTLPKEPNKVAGVLVRDGVLTHFQAEQILQGKWRRFTIGKYKVLERLGSGGMGSVYLCEHKLMRRRVAVKVLPTAKAAEPSSLERFYREARAVASLDHPNIVHAYDIDQDETLHFLVMEYVDGASLQEIVKISGPMDPIRAAHYIHQAAQGLEHAHAAGLVHRDIKPGNLLVDRTGTVKILDMGLARFFNDSEDVLTKKYDEHVLGTADYLAPEQAVDSHEADTRADVYSLGATFYFMLTGRTPFDEGTIAQKLIWHQTRQPKPITAYRPDVPPGLIDIINKMMAKRSEDRYQRLQEVSQALAPWTRQAIEPPTANEMPRLSLAATGTNTGEVSQTGLPHQSGAGSSRKNWHVSPSTNAAGSSTMSTPAPRPGTAPPSPVRAVTPSPVRPATPSPQRTAGSPAPQAAPLLPTMPRTNRTSNAITDTPDQLWENITQDTKSSGRHTNNIPEKPLAGPKSVRRTSFRNPPTFFWIIVSVVIIAAAIGVGLLLWKMLTPATSDVKPAERKPLAVSRQRQGPGIYPTIEMALSKAKQGDVIELWDERHEENLVISSRKGTTGVTLQAAPGRNVVWTSRKGVSDLPLLQLTAAPQFVIKGEGITLDGQGQTSTLIEMSMRCPGLNLEDLTLKDFKECGIKILNCMGDPGQPVMLQRLRLTLPPAPTSAGICFDANPSIEPNRNDHITIQNCDFGGTPPERAIRRKNVQSTGGNLILPAGHSWTP